MDRKPEWKKSLKRQKIILKWILGKTDFGMWIGFMWLKTVASDGLF
jgi:hypothetical protein